MKYVDYLSCAGKHLKACSSLLMSYKPNSIYDWHVWMELYYLSGYIIEGITIYSTYKLNNWPLDDDITCRNDAFTQITGIDFYRKRIEGNKVVSFKRDTDYSLCVEGHNFQKIAEKKLQKNPSFNDVPYIGSGDIDPDVKILIDEWTPKIRYKTRLDNDYPQLNQDVINRLINTCRIIFVKHI